MLIHNKGNYTRHAAGVMLIPGANQVDANEFEQFSKHPLMAKLIEKGEIVAEKGLKDLNADDAIELVKDTHSIEYLEAMKIGETRKTVISAIEAQIKTILGENEQN